jgi:serine phosphatase RsbU (regulator of sigma subunit)/DNA-binding LacI/PurR family transcriptional regulator/AcrR family transcriptional regulator
MNSILNNQSPSRQSVQQSERLTIAYLARNFSSGTGMRIWRGVVDGARTRNVNLLCVIGGRLGDEAGNILYDLITSEHVDGIVTWASSNYGDALSFYDRYNDVPLVSITLPLPERPVVTIDNYPGMYEIIAHLIEAHACRHIAFLRGPENHHYAQERYRAYTEALAAYDLPFVTHLVVSTEGWGIELGRQAMTCLLEERQLRPGEDIDAVVAANDNLAAGALDALQARNIHVPKTIVVAGFNDSIIARSATPAITSVTMPFHEQGALAVETVVAMCEGRETSDCVALPASMVVHESCGCLDAGILKDTADIEIVSDESLYVNFGSKKAGLLTELGTDARTAAIPVPLLEQLLDAFVENLQNLSSSAFLWALHEILLQDSPPHQDVSVWQEILSGLRQHLLPLLNAKERAQAEHCWHQSRMMIAQMTKRQEERQRLLLAQQEEQLNRLGASLITTFDVQELLAALTEELPDLGLPGCYLALYEDPRPYTFPQPAPQWSRLMMAYAKGTEFDVHTGGQRILSQELVCKEFLFSERQFCLVIEPLYFRESQIGVVLFEMGPDDADIYDILRSTISSALQGALLVQRVQEHSMELATAYEEIHILNEQLKEENVRMHAELDVARRLQSMVLPPPAELRQISGLDLVGYMQPADEVGGDYYDVIARGEGRLYIGIGDVTGHGLESGVLMLMAQTAIRTLIDRGETDPKIFLNTLNRVLYQNIQRMHADKSLTLSFVRYKDGYLKLIGQHEELLVIRKNGDLKRVDTINLGFPLGLEENITQWINETTVHLDSGDGIVLYTDGITEAENISGEMYGIDRLCEVVRQNWRFSAERIKQAVVDDVFRHIGKQKVYDDITLVVLKQQ